LRATGKSVWIEIHIPNYLLVGYLGKGKTTDPSTELEKKTRAKSGKRRAGNDLMKTKRRFRVP